MCIIQYKYNEPSQRETELDSRVSPGNSTSRLTVHFAHALTLIDLVDGHMRKKILLTWSLDRGVVSVVSFKTTEGHRLQVQQFIPLFKMGNNSALKKCNTCI
jgi:hypothetical protein